MIIAGHVCLFSRWVTTKKTLCPNEIAATSPMPLVMMAFEIADWERATRCPGATLRSRNARRHNVAGWRHANHRLEIPLPGLAVNASALEGGTIRHDLHGLLHLLMGKHNPVALRAKTPFVRSTAGQADAAVPRQLGDTAPS